MKIKIEIIIFVATLIFFTGCKKDKVTEPTLTPNPTAMDIDGNVYHTVTIGTQVWMVENLKVLRYRNGDPIPHVTIDTTWNHLMTGAYRDYADNTANGNTYGHLYNWYAVGDSRNVAPVGWHIATRAEWTTLADYLGGLDFAGGKMKETGFSHWASPNTGATNESGFTGLPGGGFANAFGEIGNWGQWWTATDWNTLGAYNWNLYSNNTTTSWNSQVKFNGFSIRCVKD